MLFNVALASLFGLAIAKPQLPAYPSNGPLQTKAPPAPTATTIKAEPYTLPSSIIEPPPVATLQPTICPGHDLEDLKHLTPSNQTDLYYAHPGTEDTELDHEYANVGQTFNYPASVLEYSKWINSIACNSQGMEIGFSVPEAMDHAKEKWGTQTSDFLLISHTDQCDRKNLGQRTYWLVDAVEFPEGELKAVVKCKEIPLAEAVDRVDMTWGNYKRPTPPSDSVGTQTTISTGFPLKTIHFALVRG